MNMLPREYHHGSETLPVTYDVDVLVVGGGPAGIGAALAAARQGMRVLIVEQFNCLGGVAGAGGHGAMHLFTPWRADPRIVGGIPAEIAHELVRRGFGEIRWGEVDFEVEGLKLILDEQVREAGVQLLYYTFFCESLVEQSAVVGAVVQNKTGRQAILAKRVVDCTGDGDAAASAGAPFEQGRTSDHKCQPVTLMFTIGGVDWSRVSAWRTDFQMAHVWKTAQENGDMEPFQSVIMNFIWTPTRPDHVGINFTHITNIDTTKCEDLTAATIEGRRQAFHATEVFRKYVPGMERCFIVSTPNTIGLRESRRILGEVVLTEQDMLAQRTWDDSIGYGSFFIDVHHIDGPGMDQETFDPEPGFKYQIPYRILVPRTVENILTAGRCVSVTHIALGSIRVMVQCMLTGEAAGAAAALSIREGVTPRNVNIRALQSLLRQSGAILSEEDIAH